VRQPISGAEGPLRRVRRDDGSPIDATFRVERVGESPTVVFESRGGTRGSEAERNADYASGLELLLARLCDAGFQLAES
jgi:hypothetical protein